MNPSDQKWKASAMLFSGRPNPEWELTLEQQKEWLRLWDSAFLQETPARSLLNLGYTGCRLQKDEQRYWQVYNGAVCFFDAGKMISKKDAERRMEYFILATAPNDIKGILKGMKIIK